MCLHFVDCPRANCIYKTLSLSCLGIFFAFFMFPSYPYVLFNLFSYVLIFLFIVMYCTRSISLLSVYVFLSLKKERSLSHMHFATHSTHGNLA